MYRSILSVVVVTLGTLNALAVPVERRESVLSTCNTVRLGVISSLNSSSRSIGALLDSSNDSAVIFASNQALSGLHTSQGGVATIVKGVLAGVTPDDTGVPAIASGLATVAQALSSIKSTNDSNVQSQLATILAQVDGIKTNGDSAIAECAKLSQSSSNSSVSNSTSSDSNSNSNIVTVTAPKSIRGAASVGTEISRALSFGRRALNSQCDLTTTEVVSAIEQATKVIQLLAKTAKGDNSTQTAANAAIAALNSAGGVVTNVQDVASAANIIGQSIVDAQDLLNLINSTDSSVISALDSAQLDMIGMLSAGQNLAIDCTPTAGGVAAGKRRRRLGAFIREGGDN
ncbi:hypothetical protein F5876DRAFT_74179 [Lentinula aff. lateritia]|uniref:Uncharacterized protein n=1 Tax=Lentinula aff. lateritia TaxID=2804960 RepID=A0ACC1U7W1_9AGAR|nr:hypothetical protein F5876DRAFT_74179 [Lentinula aff. lateritia]